MDAAVFFFEFVGFLGYRQKCHQRQQEWTFYASSKYWWAVVQQLLEKQFSIWTLRRCCHIVAPPGLDCYGAWGTILSEGHVFISEACSQLCMGHSVTSLSSGDTCCWSFPAIPSQPRSLPGLSEGLWMVPSSFPTSAIHSLSGPRVFMMHFSYSRCLLYTQESTQVREDLIFLMTWW